MLFFSCSGVQSLLQSDQAVAISSQMVANVLLMGYSICYMLFNMLFQVVAARLPCGCYGFSVACYGVANRFLWYPKWLLGCC